MTTTASVNGDAIAPRVAYAAKCLLTGRTDGRYFASCFMNDDGDLVLFALYRRGLRNPKLAAAMRRTFTSESLAQCESEFASMWGDLKGQRIEDVARALREAAFLRRNPPPAIVRMTEAHGTRAELVA